MRKKLVVNTLLGLGVSANAFAEAPSVAVDIAPLHSLVSQVMAGVDQPDLLIPAEASPHSYNLRPSQAKALADAQVVFWMGEQLTPWLEKAMNNVADSAQKIGMLDLEATTTYAFREGATFEGHAHHDEEDHDEHAGGHEEHDDHDHHEEHAGGHEEHHDHDHKPGLLDRFLSLFGSHDHHDEHEDHGHDEHKEHKDEHGHDEHEEHHHDHEGVDPHAWLDPANAKAWLKEIERVLSEQDPANAEVYASNAKNAIASMDELIGETQTQITNLGELKFIVFHDAYQYFEKRFGISAAGSISLGDAEDPSPARVKEIQETVQKLGVSCTFAEPQYDQGIVRNVFEGSSITSISVMDPLGASIKPSTGHYAQLIKGMTKSLSACKPSPSKS